MPITGKYNLFGIHPQHCELMVQNLYIILPTEPLLRATCFVVKCMHLATTLLYDYEINKRRSQLVRQLYLREM